MKTNKSEIFFYFLIVGLLLLLVASARGQENQTNEIQMSGGAFTITKTVVAGGGQTMQNAPRNASATTGQTVAGKTSSGGQFSLYSGFWTPDDFTPTAAGAVVSGQIKTADGRGIRNVLVTIVYPSGQTQITASGSMGYYSFADIPVGATYVISVAAKRHTFSQPAQIRNVMEDVQDVDFIADAF